MYDFSFISQLQKFHVEAAEPDIATDGKVRKRRRTRPCSESTIMSRKNSRTALHYMVNGKAWDSVKIAELVGGKTNHFSHVMRTLARLGFAELVGQVVIGKTKANRYRLTENGMRVALELQSKENGK